MGIDSVRPGTETDAATGTGTECGVEHVVLLSEQGLPTGTAPKLEVHTDSTPLHLAFSCYVFNPRGDVLVTRRALTKQTWPGVWTNSCCGHPAEGEDMFAAIARRLKFELGIEAYGFRSVLPDFRYRATDASGIVENEVCPVYVAQTDAQPLPNPAEVDQWHWVKFADLAATASRTPWALSPWAVDQLSLMKELP